MNIPYPYDHDRYTQARVSREIALLEHVIFYGLGSPIGWKTEFDGSLDPHGDLRDVARKFKLALFDKLYKEQSQLDYPKRDDVVLLIEDVVAYLHVRPNRYTEEYIYQTATEQMIESMRTAMKTPDPRARGIAWCVTWALHACATVGDAHLVAKFCNQATGRAVSWPDPPKELWQAENEAKAAAWTFYADTLLTLLALAPCKAVP